jgi:poly-gamma-glutamate synthesis protein (capsule biosynthesis protein)
VTVFVPEGLPAPVTDMLNAAVTAHPDLFAPSASAEISDVQVTLDPGPDATPLVEWVYAVVAPFPTLTDEVAWADVAGSWSGVPAGPFAGRPLLVTDDTLRALSVVLGDPVPGVVEVVPPDQIAQRAWDTRPAWAIVPFDQLEPRWKVLRVDGVSVLDKGMDAGAWPLVVRAGLTGMERGVAKLKEVMVVPLTNRDPEKMTVVVMTGVTALCRATAMRMDRHGVTYPAEDIPTATQRR